MTSWLGWPVELRQGLRICAWVLVFQALEALVVHVYRDHHDLHVLIGVAARRTAAPAPPATTVPAP